MSKPELTDAFKMKLVAESFKSGVTVPMLSKRYNVPAHQIYGWRQSKRFRQSHVEDHDFTAVQIREETVIEFDQKSAAETMVEIILSNGCCLKTTDNVNADFILKLARGLAA